MQLNQLQQILTLENYSSISEAARRLYISQPALSATLNDFESEIGVILFKRTRAGIQLTAEGRVILESIRKILKEVNFIENYARQPEAYTGEISLVVGYSFEFLYPPIIHFFKEQFPQAVLKPLYDVPPNIASGVNQGLIDFAIATVYNPDGTISQDLSDKAYQGLTVRKLREIQTIAILHRDNPLAQRPSLNLSDLSDEQLILGRQFDIHYFTALKRFSKYPIQNINRSTIYDLLDRNYGVFIDATPLPLDQYQAILAKYAIKPLYNDILPQADAYFHWPAYLIYKSHPPTHLHQAFLDNLERIFDHYKLFID
ncbi:LysR family transcriptional regulator [Peptococcus simiae]|uniref:LysR family transcriptional regulator n=1 Tax=Peptococcus simiae TaxID=1643805 RepID=A0ABW9GZK3_9FIRM